VLTARKPFLSFEAPAFGSLKLPPRGCGQPDPRRRDPPRSVPRARRGGSLVPTDASQRPRRRGACGLYRRASRRGRAALRQPRRWSLRPSRCNGWPAPSRAAATLPATSALPSAGGGRVRSAADTPCTSTCRSIRSKYATVATVAVMRPRHGSTIGYADTPLARRPLASVGQPQTASPCGNNRFAPHLSL
jgi:hypothetical protein